MSEGYGVLAHVRLLQKNRRRATLSGLDLVPEEPIPTLET